MTSAGSSTRCSTSTASGCLRFRQAVGLPGFNRLLRLAETTCGDDAKVPAGLTEELIQSVTQPVLGIFGEHSPFLATADYLAEHLPNCVARTVAGAKHRAPEENGAEFVEIVNEFSDRQFSRGSHGEGDTMNAKPTVLVTGAAHGIGRATAIALARKGMPLGLIDRDAAALAELAQTLKSDGATAIATAAVDVTDRDGLFAAVDRLAAELGPIDVLVACAGIGSLTLGARARHVDAAADARSQPGRRGPVDRGRPAGDDRAAAGHIVGVASMAGYRGFPWMISYSASKAAPDRLPRGDAARAAQPRRDGDHRLPRLRPHQDVHRHSLSAPGQDDRARRGGPAPRPRRRAPAAQLRLSLQHEDRPGHPEVHAGLVLRLDDAPGRPQGAERRVLNAAERLR